MTPIMILFCTTYQDSLVKRFHYTGTPSAQKRRLMKRKPKPKELQYVPQSDQIIQKTKQKTKCTYTPVQLFNYYV